jgi:hypothetical protein
MIKVNIGEAYVPERNIVRTPTGEYRAYRPLTGHLCDVRGDGRAGDRMVFATAVGCGALVAVLVAVGVIV